MSALPRSPSFLRRWSAHHSHTLDPRKLGFLWPEILVAISGLGLLYVFWSKWIH
jgi:hypothetical protein